MSIPQLKLKPTQRLLWQCITAPDEERQRLKKTTILPIRGDRRLSAFARVDIYARMYFWRIVDSLKEDFPSLWELMTEDEFHSLMRKYLTRHPSSHWTLRDAGQHLPQFLKKHVILKKWPSGQWPFLVDLARFEWEMIEAFDAADGTLLGNEQLRSLKPQAWGHLSLQLVPSHRLLRCQWPLHQVRESILESGTWSGEPKPTFLQVWRKEQTVFYRPVDPLEYRLLKSLKSGSDFASLCQKIVDQVGGAQASGLAARYLQSWLKDKILLG